MGRVLIILVLLAVIVWMAASYYRARTAKRMFRTSTVLAAFPAPPFELTGEAGAAMLPETTCVYEGTSMAGDWHDRVGQGDVAQPTPAVLHLSGAGLLIDRSGASPLWIPAGAIRGAHAGRSLAGTVQPNDGYLIVTWQLGGHLLDTGFRGDEAQYGDWIGALRALGSNGRGGW